MPLVLTALTFIVRVFSTQIYLQKCIVVILYKPLQMKEVIIMALIRCKECGEIISDNAISCPYCGNQRKYNYPTPYYPDIEIIPHLDDDSYYDTKNHREISFGEYLTAKSKYEEECEKKQILQQGQVPEDVKRYIRKR